MTRLDKLYARIPAVDCIPGCTDCCGIIPMSTEQEIRAMGPVPMARWDPTTIITTDLTCGHSKAGNCAIHERRPFMCRIYATATRVDPGGSQRHILCPHGRGPKKPLSQGEVRELTLEYFEIAAGGG